MAEPIQGRIAKVLNSRDVAINRGSDHGVEKKMLFDVLDRENHDIQDPETGQNLGSFRSSRIRLVITHVDRKFAVASTRGKTVNEGGRGQEFGVFARHFLPPKWVTKYETLARADESGSDALDEKDSCVKTGDPVIQVESPGDARKTDRMETA